MNKCNAIDGWPHSTLIHMCRPPATPERSLCTNDLAYACGCGLKAVPCCPAAAGEPHLQPLLAAALLLLLLLLLRGLESGCQQVHPYPLTAAPRASLRSCLRCARAWSPALLAAQLKSGTAERRPRGASTSPARYQTRDNWFHGRYTLPVVSFPSRCTIDRLCMLDRSASAAADALLQNKTLPQCKRTGGSAKGQLDIC